MKSINGWYEGDTAAIDFEYKTVNIRQCAERMYDEFGDDCLGVDIEATTSDGLEVGLSLARMLEAVAK